MPKKIDGLDPPVRTVMKPRWGNGSLLTPEIADAIVKAVQLGLKPSAAAARFGIPRATFFDWMARGEGRRPKKPAVKKYQEFVSRIHAAKAQSVSNLLGVIRQEAQHDARLALDLLKSCKPMMDLLGDDVDDEQSASPAGVTIQIVYPDGVTQTVEPPHADHANTAQSTTGTYAQGAEEG